MNHVMFCHVGIVLLLNCRKATKGNTTFFQLNYLQSTIRTKPGSCFVLGDYGRIIL